MSSPARDELIVVILRGTAATHAVERELIERLNARIVGEGVYLLAGGPVASRRAREMVEEIARLGGSAVLGHAAIVQ